MERIFRDPYNLNKDSRGYTGRSYDMEGETYFEVGIVMPEVVEEGSPFGDPPEPPHVEPVPVATEQARLKINRKKHRR